MAGSIQKFAQRMRYWCDQANLGYDQSQRWDIRVGGECDCSSLVIFALREAGFDTGSASYTGDLAQNLLARGWVKVANNGKPRVGDILLNECNHVAACTGNGIVSYASIDERGKISGGKSGDQTDRETKTVSYYNYPWDFYLRYKGSQSSSGTTNSGISSSEIDRLAREVINGKYGNGDARRKALGSKYYAVQKRVDEILNSGSTVPSNGGIGLDGIWGNETTRATQRALGTYVDGIVEGQSNSFYQVNHGGLLSSTWKQGVGGSPMVRALQRKVGVSADGLFGPQSCRALQHYLGTEVDGFVDYPSNMVYALQKRLNAGTF